MIKRLPLRVSTAWLSLAVLASFGFSSVASAVGQTAASSDSTKNDAAKLKLVIAHGDKEISRRLTTLNALATKLNATTKLSAANKTALTSEVNTEVSDLTSLKTKLDSETSFAAAKADAQSVFSDYRVYALLVPKVNLLRTADAQAAAEAKVADVLTRLQNRLATKTNVTNLSQAQTALTTASSQLQAATALTSAVETKVAALEPSDYNSDHSVLSGQRDQLKTAQADLKSALQSAKTVVTDLKQ